MSSNLYRHIGIHFAPRNLTFQLVFFLISGFTTLIAQPVTPRYSKQLKTQARDEVALHHIERARMMASLDFLDSALYLIDEAKCLTSDSAILSKCFRIEGQVHSRLNNLELAEIVAKKGLEMLPNHYEPDEALIMHNLLGSIDVFQGNFEEAFLHFHSALACSDRAIDQSRVATIFMNYGVLYYKMFDYETAIKFWLAALESDLPFYDADICRINLALAYTNLGHCVESSRLLKVADKWVASMGARDQINFFYAMGTLYDSIGNVDSARIYFEKSLTIATSRDPRHAAEDLLSLARIDIKSQDLGQGETLLNSAEKIARSQNFQDILLRCLWERIRLTALKGDLSARIRAQEEYLSQRKIFFDVNMSRIASVHTQKLLKEAQARQHSINEKRLEVTATLAKMHKRYQKVILIIGGMLFALAILLFYRFRIITKQKRVLEEAVKARMVHLETRNTGLADVLNLRNQERRRMQFCIDSVEYTFEEYGAMLRRR